MRSPAPFLLVLLAACASPGEIRRDGVRYDFTLKLPPAQAIQCMTRNAEERAGVLIVQQRSDGILIRNTETPLMVADVHPDGAGSRATIWRSSTAFLLSDMPAAMAKGC